MPRSKSEGDKIICFYVPEAIKRRIRVTTAETDKTQQDWLLEVIEEKFNRLDNSTNSGTEDIPDAADLCCEFLKELVEGKRSSNGKMVKLSHLLGVDVEVLTTIRDRYLDGREASVKNTKVSKV